MHRRQLWAKTRSHGAFGACSSISSITQRLQITLCMEAWRLDTSLSGACIRAVLGPRKRSGDDQGEDKVRAGELKPGLIVAGWRGPGYHFCRATA